MKSIVFLCASSAFVASATTWYVDANNGNDDYDGKQLVVDKANLKGPKQTLAWFDNTRLSAGDIIYAAPGHYNTNSVAVGGHNYRFWADPRDVKLIAVGGPSVTFIEGEPDTTVEAAKKGCGAQSVACVYFTRNCLVKGFTISGGRSTESGAGAIGNISWDSVLAGCILTNNVTGYRGGALYGIKYLVNCQFADSYAIQAEGGAAMNSQYFVNCSFMGSYAYDVYNQGLADGCRFLNCTSYNDTNGSLRSNSGRGQIYNTVIGGTGSASYKANDAFNTVFQKDPERDGSTTNGECRLVAAVQIAHAANGAPLSSGNASVDSAAAESYYEANFPSGLWCDADIAEYKAKDVLGRPRKMGAAMDLGAFEYDWYADFSRTLSPAFVTVTNATAGVSLLARGVVIPAGNELAAVWSYPAGCSGSRTFSFSAVVSGAGVLNVYLGDSEEPAFALATGDSGPQTFVADGDRDIRFEMTGEGNAVISDLWNCTMLVVRDECGDLAFAGEAKGSMPILTETSVVIRRAGQSARPCFGLLVNGVYRKFAYADAADAYSVSLKPGDASLVIEAVYGAQPGLIVDPVNGNEGNDGTATFRAKKNLAAATRAVQTAGQTVYALPGYHTNDIYVSSSGGRFRGYIAAGVTLEGVEGAAKTFIVGAPAPGVPTTEDPWGMGEGAIRGVYLCGNGSVLRGVTVADAYSNGSWGSGATSPGYEYTCLVEDCVFTNCVSVRGGALYAINTIRRTRILDCRAKDLNGAAAHDCPNFSDCLFDGGKGAYEVYNNNAWVLTNGRMDNCTFGKRSPASVHTNTKDGYHIYNSINMTEYYNGCVYHNCLVAMAVPASRNDTLDASVVRGVSLMKLDDDYRPTVDSPARDAGKDFGRSPSATDVSGGQRIYNACIDLGALEHDARPELSKQLATRRVAVTQATGGVSGSAEGVVLSDGCRMTVEVESPVSGFGSVEIALDGEGCLLASLDGERLTVSDGTNRFAIGAGRHTLEFAYVGEGTAEVSCLRPAAPGMMLIVR